MQNLEEQIEIAIALKMAKSFREFMNEAIDNGLDTKSQMSYMVGCLVGAKSMCRTKKARNRISKLLETFSDRVIEAQKNHMELH